VIGYGLIRAGVTVRSLNGDLRVASADLVVGLVAQGLGLGIPITRRGMQSLAE
jgi:hypothetical protein